jgi:outer membrane receptor protein involved in Fe transport
VRSTSSSLDTVRDDSESVSVQAGYSPADALDGRLMLSGGVRAEWRAAPGDADDRDTATVGQVGAAYRVDDTVWIRGQVATSHRWPTLNELIRGFRVGDVITNANPDLLPERSRSIEGAVVFDRGRVMTSAGLFHTRVSDAVANVTLPSLTNIVRERRNAGEVHSTGLELDVEVRPDTRLRARGSLALIDSTFAESLEPGIAGNRVPQVPRVSGSVSVDLLLPRDVGATIVWRSSSTQYDDDRNVFELAAANEVNARVAGRAGSFEWRVSFENLFDQRIEVGRTPLVTLAPGRAIRVGLAWSR